MQELVFGLASFLIAAIGFGFGAFRLFRSKKPLYLQLFVCAAGCFAVQQMSYVVNLWCGVTRYVSVGMLGIFGCNFFLLSANFGTLDKIVDDGKGTTRKARLAALIAPAVLAALTALAFFEWKDKDLFCAVVGAIVFIPALPASYFNLKHILLPTDPFEFLRCTRPGNIASLAFYLITAAYMICSAFSGVTVCGILFVLMSLAAFALSLCAVKEEKKWGI